MARKEYNGHESWNAWNVALWIGNDEWLYNLAMECIKLPRKDGRPVTAKYAATRFNRLCGETKTPDGAKYSHRSVMLAMQGLMEE